MSDFVPIDVVKAADKRSIKLEIALKQATNIIANVLQWSQIDDHDYKVFKELYQMAWSVPYYAKNSRGVS